MRATGIKALARKIACLGMKLDIAGNGMIRPVLTGRFNYDHTMLCLRSDI
jgi:hypothetical protein